MGRPAIMGREILFRNGLPMGYLDLALKPF